MESKTTEQPNVSTLYQQASDTKAAYICSRIEGQISYYEAKSARSKNLYYLLSALAIVANAAVPVISVFLKTADGNDGIKMVIAILSSLALIATSLLTLFNTKELWNKYRSSASGLTSLLHQYYTRTGLFEGLGEEEAFRLLAKLAEAHLEQEQKDWEKLLKNSPSGK